jgi:hypothetical protein
MWSEDEEEGQEESQEEEVTLESRTPLIQEGCYMAPKKKATKKAGKATKKKSYYRGKEVRACKSR